MENTTISSYPASFRRPDKSNSSSAIHWLNEALKRLIDICAALLGLVLLAPFFGLIAILSKRDTPGPVLYRGPRLGRGGTVFQIVKFRSMYARPESDAGPRLTAQDDPRITPLGRWLRDTKINELPQLWNVLVGEMSLVGPRPEDPHLADEWPPAVREEVLSVRPGITSPASVLYRDEEALLRSGSLMDTYLGGIAPSKQRLDQLYVRYRSIWLDMDTLLWTFLVTLPRVGAIQLPEENLFLGPISRLIRRHVSWFMIDTLVTFGAIATAGLFWRSLGPLNVGWPKAVIIAVVFAQLYSISNFILGVNRISWSQASFSEALDLLPAIALASVAILALNYLWPARPLLPVGMLLMGAAMASMGFVTVRYRDSLLSSLALRLENKRSVAAVQERVLIVGGGESGQFVAWWLQNGSSGDMLRVAGYIDDDLFKQGTRIHGVNVIGRGDDIPDLVREHDAGILVFAIHNIPAKEKRRLLDICNATGARVVMVPDVLGNLRQFVDDIGRGASRGADRSGDTPLAGASPAGNLDSLLAELDELAQLGDLEALRMRIHDLHNHTRV